MRVVYLANDSVEAEKPDTAGKEKIERCRQMVMWQRISDQKRAEILFKSRIQNIEHKTKK